MWIVDEGATRAKKREGRRLHMVMWLEMLVNPWESGDIEES